MNRKNASIVIIGLLIIGALCYWFIYRPYKVRRICASQSGYQGETNYEMCLHSWGL